MAQKSDEFHQFIEGLSFVTDFKSGTNCLECYSMIHLEKNLSQY